MVVSDHRRIKVIWGVLCLIAAISLTGCGAPPHTPKPTVAPDIVHCFDTVGHRTGAKPWLLGGTCCCTPSQAVLEDWQQHGYFVGKTVQEVIDMYNQEGIQLACDHQGCNNACQHGPHVIKGGKCMAPPTPGTENYEEVLFGMTYVPKAEAPKAFRQVTPSTDIAYTPLSSDSSQGK